MSTLPGVTDKITTADVDDSQDQVENANRVTQYNMNMQAVESMKVALYKADLKVQSLKSNTAGEQLGATPADKIRL